MTSIWNNLNQSELADFRYTLKSWLSLRICSANMLSERAGYSKHSVYEITAGRRGSTHTAARDIMDAIGQIESEYVARWQQERARQRLGGRVVQTYGAGVQA